MKISINAQVGALDNAVHDSVIDRMTKDLNRLSRRITSVNVKFTDENGPRGGVDKRCRVSVVLPPFSQLTASATAENPWAALTRAGERVRRLVLKKLKRSNSLRTRKGQEDVEVK